MNGKKEGKPDNTPAMGGPGGARFKQVEKPKNVKRTVVRIWGYLSKHYVFLLLAFVCIIISSLLNLVGPMLIGRAINFIGSDLKNLGIICLQLTALYITGAGFAYAQMLITVSYAQNTVLEMRRDLFYKLQKLPLKYFDSTPHGELMSRVTNDIDNVSTMLNTTVSQIISSIIQVVGCLGFMLYLSPILTLASLVTVPIVLLITKFITKHSRAYFSRNQKVLGQLNGKIEEIISGQKTVKVFTREEDEIKQFRVINDELAIVSERAQSFSGIMGPIMNACNNLSYVLVVAVGAWLVITGKVNIGLITSFTIYARQFVRPINEIANQYNTILSAVAGGERVFEVMDQTAEPPDDDDAGIIENLKGEVVLTDVDFSYKENVPVLKSVNLYATAGQMIALVGPTGAGKTTIINLLTRFYDIQKGNITIDGIDLTKLKRNFLRTSLGFVLQDTYLFAGTIKDNIKYSKPDAADDEIIRASQLANAHEFIRRLPHRYDTELTENADNLSQGQKQMIAIARVILLNPAILILDEATSNVDTRTEVKIQQAMQNLMHGRTCFVIAHRLSTIKNADLIAVINHGEIVERGNHERLLEKKGFYYDLYMSQFS